MAAPQIPPPSAGVLVRHTGMAASAMRNATRHAARLPTSSTSTNAQSTLKGGENGFLAVYPDQVALYRAKGSPRKPINDLIENRWRSSIRKMDLWTATLSGRIVIAFDDEMFWDVEFAGGARQQAQRVIEALTPPPAPTPGG